MTVTGVGVVRDDTLSGADVVGDVHVSWAAVSDVGRSRETNEDAALAIPGLYVVADGMGGHDRGEVASEAALESLRAAERADIAATRLSIVDRLDAAQQDIAGIDSASGRSAGTTVTGIALVDDPTGPQWLVFNIGDSRTYRYAAGQLDQVTTDHSQVQELVAAGYLTVEQARVDPRRNVITRALGAGMPPDADFVYLPAVAGELILICSDGLPGELPDAEIEAILTDHPDVVDAADALVEAAVATGGRDNVTVVVVAVTDAPAAPDPAATETAATETTMDHPLVADADAADQVDGPDEGTGPRT
ncbi:PP2C family protein-serine/threonine phosphatase [Williamsia sterculiae]|uniref:Protein phosphatase n=1 Tax=Williamsia sterculiae TaxID=1344003 RepID=A0A1N7EGU8_9NOCA|nr:protein phosphatase 2C domain-containing protein [Williamsia sterculiae]SIR87145.1 protein phosphatase [Williamsia sterculiae]